MEFFEGEMKMTEWIRWIGKVIIAVYVFNVTVLMEMTIRAIIGMVVLLYYVKELQPYASGQLTPAYFSVVIIVWMMLPLWWQFGANGFNRWLSGLAAEIHPSEIIKVKES